MARAVTRDGTTTIYGPGDVIAGVFVATSPLDDSPESAREASETDAALRDTWMRLLTRWEPDIERALVGDATTIAATLWRDVERSAAALTHLDTMEWALSRAAPNEAIQPLLRLVLGGRGDRTIRRWRSGESLVPEGASDFISRVQDLVIVPSTDFPDQRRLRMEIVLDD